jgi:hypothetical protein
MLCGCVTGWFNPARARPLGRSPRSAGPAGGGRRPGRRLQPRSTAPGRAGAGGGRRRARPPRQRRGRAAQQPTTMCPGHVYARSTSTWPTPTLRSRVIEPVDATLGSVTWRSTLRPAWSSPNNVTFPAPARPCTVTSRSRGTMTRSRPRPTEAVTGRASAPLSRDRSRVPSQPRAVRGLQPGGTRRLPESVPQAGSHRHRHRRGRQGGRRQWNTEQHQAAGAPEARPYQPPRPTTTSSLASTAAAVTAARSGSPPPAGHRRRGDTR